MNRFVLALFFIILAFFEATLLPVLFTNSAPSLLFLVVISFVFLDRLPAALLGGLVGGFAFDFLTMGSWGLHSLFLILAVGGAEIIRQRFGSSFWLLALISVFGGFILHLINIFPRYSFEALKAYLPAILVNTLTILIVYPLVRLLIQSLLPSKREFRLGGD